MELKNYQKNVLQDLSLFMDAVNAQNDIKKAGRRSGSPRTSR